MKAVDVRELSSTKGGAKTGNATLYLSGAILGAAGLQPGDRVFIFVAANGDVVIRSATNATKLPGAARRRAAR